MGFFILLFALAGTACAPNRQIPSDRPPPDPYAGQSVPENSQPVGADAGGSDAPASAKPAHSASTFDRPEIEERIMEEYLRWKGTEHRLGGSDRRGVDCSGFVRAVYRNVFRVELPRTTREQVRQGVPVKFGKLRAGDLVFFKPPDYPRHVGIYLSDRQFVHASKSKGVIISPLDPDYWERHFWTARRILTGYE